MDNLMKKILLLVFPIVLFACNRNNNVGKNDPINDRSISEDIEWSQMWMVSVNNHDLPRVLIIGDSHVERYYPLIAERLHDKAYCSKFTTSRSLGDPALIEQLKTVFFSFKFDIISFNNGLHGAEYSVEQYSRYIPEVYKLFIENNTGVRLIWVNTTGSRDSENISAFNEFNKEVINRNKAVENFTRANSIPLIDLYSLSNSHPEYYETDGIHFNKEGVEEEARYVSDEIIKVIENSNYIRKQ
jgi:hypothetical protein